MKEIFKQIKKFRLTNAIRERFKKSNILNVGLTTISLSELGKTTKIFSIEHSGNMGNSIARSVNPNLKKVGLPTISELKDIYDVNRRKG